MSRYLQESLIADQPIPEQQMLIPAPAADQRFIVWLCNKQSMDGFVLPEDYFAFFLVTKGNGRLDSKEQPVSMLPDHLYLLKSVPEQFIQELTADFLSYVILFKREFLKEAFIHEPLIKNLVHHDFERPVVFELHKQNYVTIHQLFSKLYREYRTSLLFHDKMLTLLFVELLFEVGRASEPISVNALSFPSRQQQIVQDFKGLVDQFFLVKRTVQQYAESLFVTAKYLSEVVKEYTGVTALHIIHARIFQEAKYWLSDARLSIKEIAEKLNFDTSSHFSRFFKQFSGYNPSDFQKNLLVFG